LVQLSADPLGSRGRSSIKVVFLRDASAADTPLLAQLNRQLIEDEGAANPMSLAELEARMREWLASAGRRRPSRTEA